MYGKFFASTFTGSLIGAGPVVFSVWGYVIANTKAGQVELNPKLLAAVIGADVDEVVKALDYLCAPDPNSRSTTDDGRRLVREGQFAYRVVNAAVYRAIRNEDDRREYNRIKQRESRARRKAEQGVNSGQTPKSTPCADLEGDLEEEEEERVCPPVQGARAIPDHIKSLEASFQAKVESWAGPTEEHEDYCRQNGLLAADEATHFFADAKAKSKRFSNWDAAFSAWLCNALKFARQRHAKGGPEPSSEREIESQHDRDKYEKILKQRKAQLAKLREEEKL